MRRRTLFRKIDMEEAFERVTRKGKDGREKTEWEPVLLSEEDGYGRDEIVGLHWDSEHQEWLVFTRQQKWELDIDHAQSWGEIVLSDDTEIRINEDLDFRGIKGHVDWIRSVQQGAIVHLGPHGQPVEEDFKDISSRWGNKLSPLLYERSIFIKNEIIVAFIPMELLEKNQQ